MLNSIKFKFVLVSDDNRVEGKLDVKTGGGDDFAVLADTTVTGELDIRTGGQNDTIGLFDTNIMAGRVNGNGGTDVFETNVPGQLPYSVQAIEFESNAGQAAMIQTARDTNSTFAAAFLAIFILGQGD